MAQTWRNRWFGRQPRAEQEAAAARRRAFRPRLERLEEVVAPTVTLGPISLSPPGPINEGSQSVLSGSYTASNVIGQLQLQVTASAPIVVGAAPPLPTTGGNFSVPIRFLDNNTPPTTPVTVSVSIIDTGPQQIPTQGAAADSGGYRAFSVPFISNESLAASLAAVGVNSGVQTLLTFNGTTNNQNGQISLGTNTFTFYGQSVGSQLGVNENGLITFNGLAPNTADTNTALTGLSNSLGAIAPLWTNLALANNTNSRVSYRFADLNGDSTPDYLIIEWSNVLHVLPGGGTSTSTGTFQVFLQLNTGTANGDIIFNYIGTNFNDPASNSGANATVGIKNQNPGSTGFTQLAFNAGQNAPIISNFASGHAVRLSSNAINLPLAVSNATNVDAFGYRAFRMPFESKADLNASTASVNGQATNLILSPTFDNSSGFQSGPQPLQSTITVGSTNVVSNNTFNFYGTTYTNLSVSKNGFINLGGTAPNGSQTNTSLAANPVLATIATLWDDWIGPAGSAAQILGRFVDYDGDGHPEYLIIDWKHVANNGINPITAQDDATFQVILQLNTTGPGQIYYNYTDTDVGNASFNNGASATVGVKNTNPTNNQFLNVSVNNVSNPDLASARALGIFPVGSSSQTTTIQVNNVPPVLSANPNDNLTVDEGSTFTRTIFVTDPGILDNFTGSVDFGDGSAVQALALPAGTTSFQISHIYADDKPGGYNVTINLTDKDGGVATPLVFNVTVLNVPPTLTVVGDQLIKPGQTLVLDGSSATAPHLGTFTDPGFTFGSTQETFTTTINWGDGTVETVPPNTAQVSQTVVNGGPGVLTMGTIDARHQFAGRGLFTVTVTVSDDDGGTDVKQFIVSVGSTRLYAVAADAGGTPMVRVFDAITRQQYLQFNAYDSRFSGGVRVATGDINGDGLPDIVTAPGPGGGPDIRVFDNATGLLIREFMAYDPRFTGGVFVAMGDVNGDGVPDIITGADAGGGAHVKVFSGVDNSVLFSQIVYAPTFRGGVRVAAGDVDGDGFADIITAPGPGGGPHVQVFSGRTGQVIRSFMAYDPRFTGGVYVGAGDVNHDGFADIITGPGVGGGPHLRVFNSTGTGLLVDTNAFPPGIPGSGLFNGTTLWTSGLRVASIDLNRDGFADIIVGPGTGRSATVEILDGQTLANLLTTPPDPAVYFDPAFLGGVFVAGK
jgi:hypothetical protein